MHAIDRANEALAAVLLKPGLGFDEVREQLHVGLRLGDVGQRVLAFYLLEVEERRLYQTMGLPSTVRFAEEELELDRRRTMELLRIGRKLHELPEIDKAFCEGRLGWSKLVLLMRVVVPEHESEWLKSALGSTCPKLKRTVRLTKPGRPPRAEGDIKGLPEIRYPYRAALDPLTREKVEKARKKLSDERGQPMTTSDLLEAVADLILESEEAGTLPGRVRVASSSYRVVVHARHATASEDADESLDTPVDADFEDLRSLEVDTPDGLLPIDAGDEASLLAQVRSEVLACDAACCGSHVHIHDDDDGSGRFKIDRKTPPGLRNTVMDRDGRACQSCGCRHGLTVHHIIFRSKGGPTVVWNLIVLCTRCHSLVHAGLLCLTGKRASEIVFADRDGNPLGVPGRPLPFSTLMPIILEAERTSFPMPSEGHSEHAPAEEPLPDALDSAWWRANAHRIKASGDSCLELRPGCAAEVEERPPAPPPVGEEAAFGRLVGQETRARRLAQTASTRRDRGESFPHTLLTGPAGTGKTTLARGVAACFGARLHECSGPLLQDTHALLRSLVEVAEGDMLFLDEIHAVPRPVLEVLYQAMVEHRVSLSLQVGGRAHAVTLELPRFTVLAATTEEGDLPHALLSRFGLRERLGFYAKRELATLICRTSEDRGLTLTDRAARLLAAVSEGTPREALRLLDRVRDHVGADGAPCVTRVEVVEALRALGYDAHGLDPSQQDYLATLRSLGRPVPLGRLARLLGASKRTLLDNLEPSLYRRGFIDVTPRGRVALPMTS